MDNRSMIVRKNRIPSSKRPKKQRLSSSRHPSKPAQRLKRLQNDYAKHFQRGVSTKRPQKAEGVQRAHKASYSFGKRGQLESSLIQPQNAIVLGLGQTHGEEGIEYINMHETSHFEEPKDDSLAIEYGRSPQIPQIEPQSTNIKARQQDLGQNFTLEQMNANTDRNMEVDDQAERNLNLFDRPQDNDNDQVIEQEPDKKSEPNEPQKDSESEAKHLHDERASNAMSESNHKVRNAGLSNVGKSHRDDMDDLSLFSSKLQGGPNLRSSRIGMPDSSESENKQTDAKNIDWVTTGLYSAFQTQYSKAKKSDPCIDQGYLKITQLEKSLPDFLFDKYYAEKIENREDRRKDILKDVHAEAGVKYIKKGIAQRADETYHDLKLASHIDQSDLEFNKVVQNYYYLGMETLRFLMDLLCLEKNYQRVRIAYDSGKYEDVLKCLLRCTKVYDGIECLGQIFLYIKNIEEINEFLKNKNNIQALKENEIDSDAILNQIQNSLSKKI